jgi:hypothetical protein
MRLTDSDRSIGCGSHLDGQRLVIIGSNTSDGKYEMVVGTQILHVEGTEITVIAQAFNPGRNDWTDSLMQETMGWDNATGLQMTLNIDDNPPRGDLDFNDLIVVCSAEDDELATPINFLRPDLTIPEKFFKGERN